MVFRMVTVLGQPMGEESGLVREVRTGFLEKVILHLRPKE
jgi:hypothetical protein